MTVAFDPIAMVKVLAEHEVDCVLLDGLAAVLHGSPTPRLVGVDVDAQHDDPFR